ncbi:MAG TPA: helix-turn-helix domain-containing protein [Microbacteriaceae bacterium]|nr:helix-turn-helix domain-containing protein [Microbacteriaceae bacterium]
MDSRDRERTTGAPASTAAVARTRERVLDALRAQPEPATIATLAARLRVHANTVRFHVDRLIATGAAERVPSPPRGPGRPAVRIRATRLAPEGPRHYRMLAEALGLALATVADGTRAAEEAGKTLGHRLAGSSSPATTAQSAMPALLDVLRSLDFAPTQVGPREINLHSCPFLEVVGPSGGTACAVHLGLMRGTIEALDASIEVESLTPFVTPTHCVTRLRTVA